MADRALERLDLTDFASGRNNSYPERLRRVSHLSPYLRHGLLTLPQVSEVAASADGGATDRARYQTELLWQEYARHWYARLGARSANAANRSKQAGSLAATSGQDGWDRSMGCIELPLDELEDDGWLVGQTRLWLASQWTVRSGRPWQEGEDYFHRHLLDGSRAANRLGWQTVAGTAGGRAYGFTRWQVERRAPGLCASCDRAPTCPIDYWPTEPELTETPADPILRRDANLERTAGPSVVQRRTAPGVVWLTAESLGTSDPALAANPDLPVVFIFDRPLLQRLQLSPKRLVFLTETLAELGVHRRLELHCGHPDEILNRYAAQGRPAAVTAAPVPGWRRYAAKIEPAEVHPWPWLVQPHNGRIDSFHTWREGTTPVSSVRKSALRAVG